MFARTPFVVPELFIKTFQNYKRREKHLEAALKAVEWEAVLDPAIRKIWQSARKPRTRGSNVQKESQGKTRMSGLERQRPALDSSFNDMS